MAQEVIEVKPYRGGWKVFEAPGVEPFFTQGDAKQAAIDYAVSRARHRSCRINVLDEAGAIEKTISSDQGGSAY